MQPWSRRHGPLRRRFVIVTVATIVALVSLFRGSSHPPAVSSDTFVSAPTTEDEDLGVAPIEEDKGDALDDGAATAGSDGKQKRPTPTFAEPCRLPAWTPRRCFRYSSLTPTLAPDACNTTRHGTMESAQGFVAAAACSSVRHTDAVHDDAGGSSKSAGRCGFWQTGSFGPAFRRCVTARLRAGRAALPSKLRHSRRCDATVAGPQLPSRWAFERRRSPQRSSPSVFFDINANAAADPSSTNRDRACTEDILLSIKGLHRSDMMAALVASLRRDVTHAPTSGDPSLRSVPQASPKVGGAPTANDESTSPKQGARARSRHTHARRKAPGKSLSQTLSAAAVGPGVMSFIGDSSQRNLFHRLVFALRGRSFVSDDSMAETVPAAAALRHSNSSSIIDDAAVFFKPDDDHQPQERRDHDKADARGGGGGGGGGEEYQEVLEHYYHADAVYAVFPSGRDALYVFQSGQYLPPEAWRLLHSVLPEGATVQSTFEAKRPMAWAPAGAQWAAADAAMRADRLTAIAERKRATAAAAIEELSDLPRHEYQTRMEEIMDAVFGVTEEERRLLFSTAPVADPAPFFVGAKAKHGRDSVADAALPSRLRANHIDDLGNPKRGLIEYNQPLDQADPLQDPRQASRGPSAARKKTPVSVEEDDTVPLLVLFHQNVLSRARPDTGAVINDKHYTDHMAALRDGVDKLRERYTAAPATTVSTASSGTTASNGNQEEQPIHAKKQTEEMRGAGGEASTRRKTMSSAGTVGPAKDGSVVLVGPRPHVVFASVNYWIRNLLKDGPKFHEGIDHHLKLYALAADPWRRLTAPTRPGGMPGDKTMDGAHNPRPGPSAGTSLEKSERVDDPSTRGDTKGTTVPPPPAAPPLVLHIVATTPHATRAGDQSKFDTALATLRAMKLQWVAEHAAFTAKYANDRSIAGGAGDRLSGEAQGRQRRRQWTPPPLLEMPRWRSAWAVLTAAERAVVARNTRRIMIDAESIAVAATGDHGLLGPTSNRAVAAAPHAQQPARPRIDEEAPMKQAPTMGLQRPRGLVSKVDSLHFMCGWFPLMQPIAHHRDIDALRIGRTGCRDPFNLAVLRTAFASLPSSSPKDH